MRIAVASWSSRRVGGTETYLERIMDLLAAAGHELAFCAEADAPAERPPLALPADVVSVSIENLGPTWAIERLAAWQPDVVYAHGFRDPGFERRLLKLAPAVFFAHGYYGTCISGEKTHRLPVIQPCDRRFGPACLALYYPRRCGGLSPAGLIRDYRRQRHRFALLRRYDAVLTASEHMRRELHRHGAAGGRVFACPFGVAGGIPGAPQPGRPDVLKRVHLVFAGRMDRLKGGAELLRAAARVRPRLGRDVHLTLAGDGPRREAWQRLARALTASDAALQIEFAGWLDRTAIAALLDRADVMVVPSLWPEPYGLVGPEANSRSVPVVAYATGGIPEWLIDGVNGYLAPGNPPTAGGLADAIVRCVENLSRGDSLRKGALAMCHARTEARHVETLLDILSQAAARHRSVAVELTD
jgi:glycosyltransferase involved in cell wall biosynthesis